MKDPLTKREKREFLRGFANSFEDIYNFILSTGALPEKEKHDHSVAKYALILTADRFTPLTPTGRQELANLRHF